MAAGSDWLTLIRQAIWRRRWIGLAVAWLLCLAGWAVVHRPAERYRSEVRVGVALSSPVRAAGPGDTVMVERALTATPILEDVVLGTMMADAVASNRELSAGVESLRRAITVRADGGQRFVVAIASTTPQRAQAIATRLIEQFTGEGGPGMRLRVIDGPTAANTVDRLDRIWRVLVVLVGGMVAGAAIALAAGWRGIGFATVDRLERRTGLSVLGAIRAVPTDAARIAQGRQARLAMLVGVGLVVAAAVIGVGLAA